MKLQHLLGVGAVLMVLVNAAFIWVALHVDDAPVASYNEEAR